MVNNLDQEDEQSTDNLELIVNIYDDINDLVENGMVNVTPKVSFLHFILYSNRTH